nr:MAG TPA: hypothetical protein [Caudoviricetes sp.]
MTGVRSQLSLEIYFKALFVFIGDILWQKMKFFTRLLLNN